MFTPDILMGDMQSKRKYQIDGGDLLINAVQRNDSGYYSCARTNTGSRHIHHDAAAAAAEISTIIKLEIICK